MGLSPVRPNTGFGRTSLVPSRLWFVRVELGVFVLHSCGWLSEESLQTVLKQATPHLVLVLGMLLKKKKGNTKNSSGVTSGELDIYSNKIELRRFELKCLIYSNYQVRWAKVDYQNQLN